jgi:DNA-binding MarR family transcriptional regulator
MSSRRVSRSLEQIAVGSVAITALALEQARADLTFPQWRVIVIAGLKPRGVAVSEIATRIGSSISATLKLVQRMQRRGLVSLEKASEDRRVTLVRPAPAGEALWTAVVGRRRIILAEVLDRLGPLDEPADRLIERLGEAFGRFA